MLERFCIALTKVQIGGLVGCFNSRGQWYSLIMVQAVAFGSEAIGSMCRSIAAGVEEVGKLKQQAEPVAGTDSSALKLCQSMCMVQAVALGSDAIVHMQENCCLGRRSRDTSAAR